MVPGGGGAVNFEDSFFQVARLRVGFGVLPSPRATDQSIALESSSHHTHSPVLWPLSERTSGRDATVHSCCPSRRDGPGGVHPILVASQTLPLITTLKNGSAQQPPHDGAFLPKSSNACQTPVKLQTPPFSSCFSGTTNLMSFACLVYWYSVPVRRFYFLYVHKFEDQYPSIPLVNTDRPWCWCLAVVGGCGLLTGLTQQR